LEDPTGYAINKLEKETLKVRAKGIPHIGKNCMESPFSDGTGKTEL